MPPASDATLGSSASKGKLGLLVGVSALIVFVGVGTVLVMSALQADKPPRDPEFGGVVRATESAAPDTPAPPVSTPPDAVATTTPPSTDKSTSPKPPNPAEATPTEVQLPFEDLNWRGSESADRLELAIGEYEKQISQAERLLEPQRREVQTLERRRADLAGATP